MKACQRPVFESTDRDVLRSHLSLGPDSFGKLQYLASHARLDVRFLGSGGSAGLRGIELAVRLLGLRL